MGKIAKVLVVLSLSLPLATGSIAGGIDDLPPEIAKAYRDLEPQQPVGPSVLRDFKPRKGPPWTIGYASSYAGNTWRAAAMARLQNVLLPKYKEAGLIKDVIITQSNLNDSVQIQQMRQLVDQGVDALLIVSPNTTTLNQAIEYAHSKGVPTFACCGYTTSPVSIGEGSNIVDGGYQMAKAIAGKIGGKGNVLLVSGIAGLTPSDAFDIGAKKALAEYPKIKLVGVVQGKWTDQVAQVEVQKFLATHPEKLDGIVLQTPSENGVLKALLQSGRPMVPISLGGEAGAACYWRSHPDWVTTSFYVWPPGDEMEITWNLIVRTLEGQGPKIQTVVRSVLPFSHDDVISALPEKCSIESPEFIEPSFDRWFPSAMVDAFFAHPHDPLTWKP
jgi:ribose transport system substrate-binding protein